MFEHNLLGFEDLVLHGLQHVDDLAISHASLQEERVVVDLLDDFGHLYLISAISGLR